MMLFKAAADKIIRDLGVNKSKGYAVNSELSLYVTEMNVKHVVEEAVAKMVARAELGCATRGIPKEFAEQAFKMMKAEFGDVQWIETSSKSEHSVIWQPGDKIRDHVQKVGEAALAACGGNRSNAAIMLGVSIRTIRNWIVKKRKTGRQNLSPGGLNVTSSHV